MAGSTIVFDRKDAASNAEIPEIYTDAYYDRLREIEDRHWWARGMRAVAASLLRSSLPRATGLEVLDAGCGTGGGLAWIKEQGWCTSPVGVDVSEAALEHCRRRGAKNVEVGSVMELPFDDDRFDLVICQDVLQHLPRPSGDHRAMAEFHRVLRAGGLVLLRCNAQRSAEEAQGEADYYRYTLEELGERVAQAGLKIRRLTYANYLSVWTERIRPRYSPKAIQRSDGSNSGLRIRMLPAKLGWLNSLLFGLLSMEATYLRHPSRRIGFGHSTFCVAEKV